VLLLVDARLPVRSRLPGRLAATTTPLLPQLGLLPQLRLLPQPPLLPQLRLLPQPPLLPQLRLLPRIRQPSPRHLLSQRRPSPHPVKRRLGCRILPWPRRVRRSNWRIDS